VAAVRPPTGFWRDEPVEAHLLKSANGASAVYLRFRLDSQPFDGAQDVYDGAQDVYDGVYVDDVSVNCVGVYASDSYRFFNGTSQAAPYVTGVAALIKPSTRTTAQHSYEPNSSPLWTGRPRWPARSPPAGGSNALKAGTG
jgi:subtilisin family serine protease